MSGIGIPNRHFFSKERQAAVQPTINASRKMFAPSQTVCLMNIYLCMHTQLGGIYLPPPPQHTHTCTQTVLPKFPPVHVYV